MTKNQILQETLHTTHLLKLLDKVYEYEMDQTRTVGATERKRDAGRTDGRSETNIPLCGGIKKCDRHRQTDRDRQRNRQKDRQYFLKGKSI